MRLKTTMRHAATMFCGLTMIVGSTSASAAMTCQAGETGCLLPIRAPVPPAAATTPLTAPAAEEAGRGIGGLLLIGGAALIAAILAFVLLDNGNNDQPTSP